jgi:MHS family proline/betaine transporter-like MFS transporter
MFTKQTIRSVLASSMGNMLEWFEFTLYAYFAGTIGQLFFPQHDPFFSKIYAFGAFAVGIASRPIGALIFGYIGDKYSRKDTMTMTMMLMSVPTMIIGLLPTYYQIGIIAPIALIILRIFQGIALGGEFGSSCVYLFESVPQKVRGFFGSVSITGAGLGLILSSLTISAIEHYFTNEEILSYAWRLPFIISVIGSLLALYMRKNLIETEDFKKIRSTNQISVNPISEMLKYHKLTILRLFTIFLTSHSSFFVVFIYGKTMMIDNLGVTRGTAGVYMLYTILGYTFATLIFGFLANYMKKIYLLFFGCLGIFSLALPFINSFAQSSQNITLLMCILIGSFVGITQGILSPYVSSSFPSNIRATSVSCCYNFSSALFGGLAPVLSMWLVREYGSADYVGYFLMTMCSISMLSMLYMIFVLKNYDDAAAN